MVLIWMTYLCGGYVMLGRRGIFPLSVFLLVLARIGAVQRHDRLQREPVQSGAATLGCAPWSAP